MPGPFTDHPVPPRGPLSTDHGDHDLALVAARAADDLVGSERERADRLFAACADCRALADDLRLLARATAELPAPAVRRRDYRLTPADAARLRPSAWRRLLAALAAPGSLGRPLAATLTTLGLAGLLLVGLTSFPLGGSAGSAMLAPVGRDITGSAIEPSAAAASPAASAPAAGGADGFVARTPEAETADGGSSGGRATERLAKGGGGSVVDIVAVLSGSLLIAGLGLYALRWTGRRLG